MPAFRDYRSAVDDLRRQAKSCGMSRDELIERYGVDIKSVESIYEKELRHVSQLSDPFCKLRLFTEIDWYQQRRPYFNVYPVIERKFAELTTDIVMEELHLPFKALEVRTYTRTVLIGKQPSVFVFVIELRNGAYQEFAVPKSHTVKSALSAMYVEYDTDWHTYGDDAMTQEDRIACVRLVAGTCMLARNASIVTPVILNRDRREGMTPAEVAAYAEKASEKTSRVGFDVGRDLQRMQATSHYRNGCFAKYYVGREHESYPKTATADRVPIIKWRSGSVVNAHNVPTVPTGFKG